MPYMRGICTKCGAIQTFEVPHCNEEPEKIIKLLKKSDFGECKEGFHVEIGKMIDYYVLDFSKSFDGDSPEFKEMADNFTPFLGRDLNMIKAIPAINKIFMNEIMLPNEYASHKPVAIVFKGGFQLLIKDDYEEYQLTDFTVAYGMLYRKWEAGRL